MYTFFMDFRKFRITKDDEDRRLDRIVRRFLPDMPLSALYKQMRNGFIRVDGKRIKPEFHPHEGSELWIAAAITVENTSAPVISAVQDTSIPDPAMPISSNSNPFTILETSDLLFINKPAGIVAHGDGGLDQLVPQSVSGRESLSFRTGPLHRLDRNTSGLLAFSRSLAGARWFSAGIQNHAFEKYYLGIAEGLMAGPAEWNDTDTEGKTMRTIAVPLAKKDSGTGIHTLVRYRIITGRKHQIRIQSSRHGHPLAGDVLYGGKKRKDFNHYFLHSWQMLFPQGRLPGIPEKIVAPLPAEFESTILEFFGEYILAYIGQGDLYWEQDEELQ
jgi:23S rRNA pseudouridine955/2504/2580 synthase